MTDSDTALPTTVIPSIPSTPNEFTLRGFNVQMRVIVYGTENSERYGSVEKVNPETGEVTTIGTIYASRNIHKMHESKIQAWVNISSLFRPKMNYCQRTLVAVTQDIGDMPKAIEDGLIEIHDALNMMENTNGQDSWFAEDSPVHQHWDQLEEYTKPAYLETQIRRKQYLDTLAYAWLESLTAARQAKLELEKAAAIAAAEADAPATIESLD